MFKDCLNEWKSENGFDSKISHNFLMIVKFLIKYWLKVFQYTDAVGTRKFKDLADFALACLSVPVSNSTVQQFFTMVSFTKTKTRNQIKSALLELILCIRSELYFAKRCCVEFVCTKEMLARFWTREIYSIPEKPKN